MDIIKVDTTVCIYFLPLLGGFWGSEMIITKTN